MSYNDLVLQKCGSMMCWNYNSSCDGSQILKNKKEREREILSSNYFICCVVCHVNASLSHLSIRCVVCYTEHVLWLASDLLIHWSLCCCGSYTELPACLEVYTCRARGHTAGGHITIYTTICPLKFTTLMRAQNSV